MAKKRKTTKPAAVELPSATGPIQPTVIDEPVVTQGSFAEKPEMEEEQPADEMPVVDSALVVPMATLRHGYEPRRCDIQKMNGKQKENLRRITNGLLARGSKLADGRAVSKPQDAIKWMLENVALP